LSIAHPPEHHLRVREQAGAVRPPFGFGGVGGKGSSKQVDGCDQPPLAHISRWGASHRGLDQPVDMQAVTLPIIQRVVLQRADGTVYPDLVACRSPQLPRKRAGTFQKDADRDVVGC